MSEIFEVKKVYKNFTEMPIIIKFLFLAGIYSLIQTIFAFVRMQPIAFTYFGSNFPKDYPLIWHLYSLVLNVFNVMVFVKRSYSLLMKYLYIGLIILGIAVLNSVYLIINMPVEQRIYATIIYTFSYILAGLIFIFLKRQKKYFNKP